MNYVRYLQWRVSEQIIPSWVPLVRYFVGKQYPLGTPPYILCFAKAIEGERQNPRFRRKQSQI